MVNNILGFSWFHWFGLIWFEKVWFDLVGFSFNF